MYQTILIYSHQILVHRKTKYRFSGFCDFFDRPCIPYFWQLCRLWSDAPHMWHPVKRNVDKS